MFGKSEVVTWFEPSTTVERRDFEAARMQHAYCWAIRKKARAQYKSIQRYAAASEQNYDRVARVLRGQLVLRLDDIGLATVVLGDVHEIASDAMRHPVQFSKTNRDDV